MNFVNAYYIFWISYENSFIVKIFWKGKTSFLKYNKIFIEIYIWLNDKFWYKNFDYL